MMDIIILHILTFYPCNNKNSFTFYEPSVLSAIEVLKHNPKVSFQDVLMKKKLIVTCILYRQQSNKIFNILS